jgi:tRNA 2-selenouridine synthase
VDKMRLAAGAGEWGFLPHSPGWHVSAGAGNTGVMAITLTSLADLDALGFDDIIDVRSPAEFAEDHLPGAISLPVLDDEERARVGTIYKQVSPFTARKLGAALVAKNAARHLEGALADRSGGWRPLVYCWRGGQRSGSFATILSQIGWRVETLAGGYKTWRGLVVQAVYDTPVAAPVVVLDGNTGSAKTEVLNLLPGLGVQVIDLEGLARHRGSLFGAMGGQPSQKAFEGALALALAGLDPARPVVVEAESSKIGERRVPPELWKAMVAAPRVAIAAPRAVRAEYLGRTYADLTADASRLAATVDLLQPLHPREVIEGWQALAAAGAFEALADSLMERHYDLRYDKHRARMAVPMVEVEARGLGADALPELAARVAVAVHGLTGG